MSMRIDMNGRANWRGSNQANFNTEIDGAPRESRRFREVIFRILASFAFPLIPFRRLRVPRGPQSCSVLKNRTPPHAMSHPTTRRDFDATTNEFKTPPSW